MIHHQMWATARRLGRVGSLLARDRILRPRAHSPGDVPAFPWAVTSAWLTDVLCGRTDRVISWEYVPISRGSTCRGRYHLVYEAGGRSLCPSTVFVKSTSTLLTRLQLGSTGAIRAETRFYREIAPTVDVLAPTGYFGASDRRSGRSILLLEDISRTRNVTFADNRTLYVDRGLASSLVDTLAALHGSLLESDRLDGELGWVISSAELQRRLDSMVDFEHRMQVGIDRAGDILPPALMGRRSEIHASLTASLLLDAECPPALVHTDVHLGNWFVTGDLRMGLCDWAAVARGQGARDLAYALASGLTVSDRRAWERDLIDEYADAVSAHAGRRIAGNDVWEAYRRQTMHGLCFWLYTLGNGGLQPRTQPDDVARINLERMAQAVVDLETLTALAA